MKKIALVLCLLLVASSWAMAQEKATIVAPAEEKFGAFPNFPSCTTGAVLHGDPASSKGVVVIAKMTAGCKIPWHWHTPNEQVGMISGTAKVQMKGEAAKTFTAGGYAFLPAKHPHEFTCTTACSLFVAADGVFDIHYVDESGKEIPPDQALKSKAAAGAKKTPAKSAPKQ